MDRRIPALKKLLRKHQIDALLISKDINLTYLTCFPASESWGLLTRRSFHYVTDFRYQAEARKGLPKGVRLEIYRKSFYHTITELLQHQGSVETLGFDPHHLTVAQMQLLRKHLPKRIKLMPASGLVESQRITKDADEIKKIKRALSIHQEALTYIQSYIKPGGTEREIFHLLEQFVRAKRCGFSFDPIIASGPNSAFPHARVSDRKIRKNDIVLVDFGIDFQGYKSDLTRMFYLGKISQQISEVAKHVRVSQALAIKAIRNGAKIADVDREARHYLDKQNLAQYFGHALGHGVGLEIHENPRLSQTNPGVLKAGMVVTVEPAVYLPGRFGIRIEDMVLVTDRGCQIISGRIR